ncbi:MAG: hypothetical protein V4475_01730 [Pseudomonadota bacterium]
MTSQSARLAAKDLYGKLSTKLARVHDSNQAPNLPLMIKLTYGEVAKLRQYAFDAFCAEGAQALPTQDDLITIMRANLHFMAEGETIHFLGFEKTAAAILNAFAILPVEAA